MKRRLLLLALLLTLAACATPAYRVDPACPDNLVLQNGEELPGRLVEVGFNEVRFVTLSGEEKIFPAGHVVRIDLGQRVGDTTLSRLADLRDREVLRLIEQAGTTPTDQRYPTSILLDERVTRLDAGKVTTFWRRLERINTQAGLDNANVTYTYNALRGRAKVDFGYSISPQGSISILSAGSVKDSALGDGRPDGSQQRLVQIAIPGGKVGGFIYFQFSAENKVDDLWNLYTQRVFAFEGPTKVIRSIIDVPAGMPLALLERNLGDQVTKTDETAAGRRTLMYQATALPQLLSEPMMVPWSEVAPMFAVGRKVDWGTLAANYRQALTPRLADDPAVEAQAKKLTEGRQGAEAAAALYAFVLREVRDGEVSMWDRDGLPKPPASTLADRHGNQLDRTVLLYALAKAVGLPVHLGLLSSRISHLPVEQIPTLGLADTPMLRFDLPGAEPVFASLGDSNRIFGMLDVAENDSFYVDLDSGRLQRTPALPASANAADYVYDIQLQPDGGARITEEHRLVGGFATPYRGYRHLEAEQIRDRMTRAVRSFAFRNRLMEFRVDGINELRDPVILHRVSETPMLAVGSGGTYSIIRLFDLRFGDLAEVNPERLYPFERSGLHQVKNTYRFHLPASMKVESLPPPTSADSPWCRYRAAWKLEGNTLTFEDITEYTSTTMPASGFVAFRALLKARREAAEAVVLLGPATPAAAAN